jgi:hypothetical protein
LAFFIAPAIPIQLPMLYTTGRNNSPTFIPAAPVGALLAAPFIPSHAGDTAAEPVLICETP